MVQINQVENTYIHKIKIILKLDSLYYINVFGIDND